MYKLDVDSWKWFKLESIFSITTGRYYYPNEYLKGDTPYCSVTTENNGIKEMIDLLPDFDGNSIIIGKIRATAFYQDSPFCATSDVNILTPLFTMSRYVGLFLVTIINFSEGYKWSYGRQCRVNDTKNIKIKLPVDSKGNPNWQFMENYIKNTIIPKLPSRAKSIFEGSFNTKALINKKLPLNIDSWKWFYLNDKRLFVITGSKTTPLSDLELIGEGVYPYITTQATNNGVKAFFNYYTEIGKVFTIDSAVKGYCSWHEEDFSASDHVEKLIPQFQCNKYIAMFLVTIINMEQYRYNYGLKCNQTRLKNMKIKLPVDSNGNPDWQFMEDYIKSLPYSANL